jgi:hypothetical protein
LRAARLHSRIRATDRAALPLRGSTQAFSDQGRWWCRTEFACGRPSSLGQGRATGSVRCTWLNMVHHLPLCGTVSRQGSKPEGRRRKAAPFTRARPDRGRRHQMWSREERLVFGICPPASRGVANVQDDDRVFGQLIEKSKWTSHERQRIDRWTLPQVLSFRNNCEPLDGFANVRFERSGYNIAKYSAALGADV